MSTPFSTPLAPFGWYADPAGSGMLRWWDGSVWTNHLEYPRPEVQVAAGFHSTFPSGSPVH